MQNLIIKGKDNPVVIEFSFTGDFYQNGLNTFARLTLQIGDEIYDTSIDTDYLKIIDNNTLHLIIGDHTQLEPDKYVLTIIGYSNVYNDGYVLTSNEKRLVEKVRVV